MIDRAQDPEAETGLFVEVTAASVSETVVGKAASVNETARGTAAAATADATRVTRRFSPPVDNTSAAAELHRRWIDRINEKLEAAVIGSAADHYLDYSGRDNLLMTLVSVPRPTTTPPSPSPEKTAAAGPNDVTSYTVGSMEGRPPRDNRKKQRQ